jgi:hypothetical protein
VRGELQGVSGPGFFSGSNLKSMDTEGTEKGRGWEKSLERRPDSSRSHQIEGAPHASAAAIEHVRVHHRGRNVAVAKQLLDGADVVTGLE